MMDFVKVAKQIKEYRDKAQTAMQTAHRFNQKANALLVKYDAAQRAQFFTNRLSDDEAKTLLAQLKARLRS